MKNTTELLKCSSTCRACNCGGANPHSICCLVQYINTLQWGYAAQLPQFINYAAQLRRPFMWETMWMKIDAWSKKMQLSWKMIQVGNENMPSDMQDVNVRVCVCMWVCKNKLGVSTVCPSQQGRMLSSWRTVRWAWSDICLLPMSVLELPPKQHWLSRNKYSNFSVSDIVYQWDGTWMHSRCCLLWCRWAFWSSAADNELCVLLQDRAARQ